MPTKPNQNLSQNKKTGHYYLHKVGHLTGQSMILQDITVIAGGPFLLQWKQYNFGRSINYLSFFCYYKDGTKTHNCCPRLLKLNAR